jgi:hypothetical protein
MPVTNGVLPAPGCPPFGGRAKTYHYTRKLAVIRTSDDLSKGSAAEIDGELLQADEPGRPSRDLLRGS